MSIKNVNTTSAILNGIENRQPSGQSSDTIYRLPNGKIIEIETIAMQGEDFHCESEPELVSRALKWFLVQKNTSNND